MNHFKKKRTYYRIKVDEPSGSTGDMEVMIRGGKWVKNRWNGRSVTIQVPLLPATKNYEVAYEMVMVEITENIDV